MYSMWKIMYFVNLKPHKYIALHQIHKIMFFLATSYQIKSNQIKSLLLSHHHSTSALVSEMLMSVLQTVQKNNRQLPMDRQCKKNNRQFTYGQTVRKNTTTTIYIWTDSAKKTTAIYIWTGQCKKTTAIYIWTDSAKNNNNNNLHMDRQCKKTTDNLHMDRQCKKATAIYIWTVHIYRLYRRQCAKYTYIYSVHIVYYKDILNYQRHHYTPYGHICIMYSIYT